MDFDIELIFDKFNPKNLQDCTRVANYLCTGKSFYFLEHLKFSLFSKILEIDKSGIIGLETSPEVFFNRELFQKY